MAKDDKLTFLEQLSNALVGQSATSGAKALGEGIGYGFGGGALSDIPDVMREAIEEHKQRTANQSKNEQDALEVASGLAAMSNPYSAVGHAMDFVGAVPDMIKYKLSDAEAPIGTIAETGLKRRLQKGGAAAEYATQNSLQRSQQLLKNQGMVTPREQFMLMESPADKWPFGAGKFQSINNYKTKAFDLSKMKEQGRPISMGADRDTNYVISAIPHQLGVEFSNTHGLKPEYRGKGYGQQIYQNMADEYGGGISHSGSTSDAARRVYDALNAIDTGIPSGGGLRGETRMALPTRAMKDDPEAMAAFQKKIDEYALPRGGKGKLPRIEVEDTGMGGEEKYLARKPNTNFSEYGATPSEAIENLRTNLPDAMRNMPSEPWNRFKYAFPEQILGEISLRLDVQKQPEVLIGGDQAIAAFGSIPDFRNAMRMQGYDAEFSGMSNTFFVKKLRQP
jgi:hypothetical protein